MASFDKLSFLDEENLVILVQEYPVLYDINYYNYNKERVCDKVWRKIGYRLAESGMYATGLFTMNTWVTTSVQFAFAITCLFYSLNC